MLYITKSPTYNQTLLALSPGILKRKKMKEATIILDILECTSAVFRMFCHRL